MSESTRKSVAKPRSVPKEFVYDAEHPVLPIPFTAQFGKYKLKGVGLSVAAAYVARPRAGAEEMIGSRDIMKLQFDFKGFSITLFPEVAVSSGEDGQLMMQFMDPAGAHLPQLRYILNSFIAGEFVSLGSMLGYSGPTTPREQQEAEADDGRRTFRRIAVLVASVILIGLAINAIVKRFTVSYESRPVFIKRAGNEMRATTGGQISFLDSSARQGEVIYSIAANTGDVLNFSNPCDCDVRVNDGIYEGATVLPSDPILTLFGSSVDVRAHTHVSIEGLEKAMNGENVFLEMSDGRSVPVRLEVTSATTTAAREGELFVPVVLVPIDGGLTEADIGEPATVRISRNLLGSPIPRMENKEAL